MSKNDPAIRVQQGDIKCHRGDIARGKSDRKVSCFSDYGGGGTIKQCQDWVSSGLTRGSRGSEY